MDGALDDFKVTEYGVEGEYLTGSFSGNLTIRDEVPESFLISGEFRVKVTNEEYDGTFIDIITEGYRLVIPNVTGSLSSEFSTLFYVRRADNGKIDFIVREIGFHEYDVVGTIALISEYRIGYLNNPSGPSLDQEITHFGEVGEMVSGFNEVPYINVFQPELGDQNLYFKFNVLRLEE
jgi:hypothetical protein